MYKRNNKNNDNSPRNYTQFVSYRGVCVPNFKSIIFSFIILKTKNCQSFLMSNEASTDDSIKKYSKILSISSLKKIKFKEIELWLYGKKNQYLALLQKLQNA